MRSRRSRWISSRCRLSLDPLDSLRPGGSNARLEGNSMDGRDLVDIKWDNVEWSEVDRGQLPLGGQITEEWEIGDVEAGLAGADLVLDETMFVQATSHQPLETRTAMAYWQNGKCYIHLSTQSLARTHAPAARWLNVAPEDVVVIGEYCGGGFGSKALGSLISAIPGLALQEGRQAGHDADQPAGRELRWSGRARANKCASRMGFRQRRPRDGARHLRRAGRRTVRAIRRLHGDG